MGIRLKQIAEAIAGELIGDGKVMIKGISGIEEAKPGDITFIANSKYYAYLTKTKASAIIVDKKVDVPKRKKNIIRIANPTLAFTKVVDLIVPRSITKKGTGAHKTAVIGKGVALGKYVSIQAKAVIEDKVSIGDNTVIGAGTYIGEFTQIGSNCLIYPNVTIRERVEIKNRVIIHSGTVIGSDGFGFAAEEKVYQKIPQVGVVIIENDVEIGANVTIDRARFAQTVIGAGTKIDNLVQIAHNVEIGKNSILVSQTGISGSTKIGDNVILAGQTGVVGHVKIGDNVIVAARGVVTKDIPAGELVSGYPAIPHMKAKRINALVNKLPQMYKKIKILEKKRQK